MKRQINFFIYLERGGAQTNLELLMRHLFKSSDEENYYVYGNKQLFDELFSLNENLKFLKHEQLIEVIKEIHSRSIVYFQDAHLLNILNQLEFKGLLVYESHFVRELAFNLYYKNLDELIEKIQVVKKQKRTHEEISQKMRDFQDSIKLEKQVYKNVDVIIANSPNTFKEIKKKTKSPVIQTQLTNETIGFFKRENFHLSSDYLFFNYPSIGKGFHKLLNNNKFKIHVHGIEPYRMNEYSSQILKSRIHLYPWQYGKTMREDILKNYQFALFPADYESMGLSLDECMRFGVICFAQLGNPGFEDQIIQNKNGFLIDFNQNWQETILEILQDYDETKLLEISQSASLRHKDYESRYKKIRKVLANLSHGDEI